MRGSNIRLPAAHHPLEMSYDCRVGIVGDAIESEPCARNNNKPHVWKVKPFLPGAYFMDNVCIHCGTAVLARFSMEVPPKAEHSTANLLQLILPVGYLFDEEENTTTTSGQDRQEPKPAKTPLKRSSKKSKRIKDVLSVVQEEPQEDLAAL